MNPVTLSIKDENTIECVKKLMNHYDVKTEAEIVTKALSYLKLIAYIDATKGELIARKGDHETKIKIS